MDEQTRKQLVQKTFNTIFEGYECSPLRFFHNAAEAHSPVYSILQVMRRFSMLPQEQASPRSSSLPSCPTVQSPPLTSPQAC